HSLLADVLDPAMVDEDADRVRGVRRLDAAGAVGLDGDALELDRAGLDDVHRVRAQRRARAADVDVAKNDPVVRQRVDDDALDAGRQDTAERTGAVDHDLFRDRHGAESTRIEAVDDARAGGLGDRAREGLARGRAAARVDVVADAGDPGAG